MSTLAEDRANTSHTNIYSSEHVYHYPFASNFQSLPSRRRLALSASTGSQAYPYFFQGQLIQPALATQLLCAVAKVVQSRFHVTAAMRDKILRMSDPIVTSGGGWLRFEGLSSCCSTYVRADFEPESYGAVVSGRGTTNVDFSPNLLAALAQVDDTESVSLSIGSDEVALLRGSESVVERKVALPVRWLRSLCEVQAYQSRMQLWAEMDRRSALQFLRSLPRAPIKGSCWVEVSGRGLRLSPREQPNSLRLAGPERLRVLEGLTPHARGLRIFSTPRHEASEWVLDFDAMRFHLAVSAEIWRGFSGEGQLLESLTAPTNPHVTSRLLDILDWQAELQPKDVGFKAGTTKEEIQQAFAVVGSRGLLGFNVHCGKYFHRILPFDLSRVEGLHPRLLDARKLIARGGLSLRNNKKDRIEIEVPGTGVIHRVLLNPSGERCTCPWFAKHQGHRGPCKHILAAHLWIDEKPSCESGP